MCTLFCCVHIYLHICTIFCLHAFRAARPRHARAEVFGLSCKAILQSDVAAKEEARWFSRYMADVGR